MREPTPGVFAPPNPDAPMPAERAATTSVTELGSQTAADRAMKEEMTEGNRREEENVASDLEEAIASGEITKTEAVKILAKLNRGQKPSPGEGKDQAKDRVVGPEQRGIGGQTGYEDNPEGQPVGASRGVGGGAEQKPHDTRNHPAGASPATLPSARGVEMRLEDRRNVFGMKYHGAILIRDLYRWLKSKIAENRLVKTTGDLFHYIRLAREERIKEEKARKAKKEAEEKAKKNPSTTPSVSQTPLSTGQQEAAPTTAGTSPIQSEQKPVQPTNQTTTESAASAIISANAKVEN